MMEVTSIELIFENCDYMEIPKNVIGDFIVEDIEPFIRRIACNSISKGECANTVAFELFKEANITHLELGQPEWATTRFERLQANDITSIIIHYDDGHQESYFVDYDEGSDEGKLGATNILQETYLSDLGNLYIVISQENELEDIFDLEKVNDELEIDFIKDMLDIGVEEEPVCEYTPESLPDFYRYVFLMQDNKTALAVRVKDESCGWKFVFEEPQRAIHFPDHWQYPNSKIVKFLDENNGDFTIKKIREEYE